MTSLFAISSFAYANPQQKLAVQSVIERVAMYADNGNYELLEQLYAPEVLIDYTSLAGGEPNFTSPQALMTSWANVLPGFDLTRHQLTNVQIKLRNDSAEATADVVADHYLDDEVWQVKGKYRYELVWESEAWRIRYHQLELTDETGSRELLGKAIENAKQQPVGYIKRQQGKALVMQFLGALESKNMDVLASVWADDAVLDMPYSPAGFPKRVSGKSALIKQYENWPKVSGSADFTSRLQFYTMQDPELLLVEFHGDVEVLTTQRQYQQHYAAIVHVDNGKIKLFKEFYNPEPFRYAFGL